MMLPDRVATVASRGSLVKICGLRDAKHAVIAATAGADLVSFIFAPARRRVSPDVARSCVDAAREAAGDREILAVGVFVDESPDEMSRIAASAGLDLVQLSGAEPPGILESLGLPAIKALRPQPGTTAPDVVGEAERYRSASSAPAGFLIDAYSPDSSGGTGIRADWALAAEVNAQRPMMLAGGLSPENVAAAIRQVRPLGVDVSSGVERNGQKDGLLIEAFIRRARAAFAESPREARGHDRSLQPPTR